MEAAIKTKNDIILLLLEELCLCMTTTEQLHPIIGLKPYHAQLIFNKKRKKKEWKQQLKLKTILLLEELCLCMTTTEQLCPIIGLKIVLYYTLLSQFLTHTKNGSSN